MGPMTDQRHILVTGAAGFIGRRTVAAARARGHRVTAISRSWTPGDWAKDEMIRTLTLDLAGPDAAADLAEALVGVDAVIHAAAALTGDAATQARDTDGAMRALLSAFRAFEMPPLLVLVSSFAVYDLRQIPMGGLVDESAPIEADGADRDAYCRSKLGQERLAREAADNLGFGLWIMRPGAVFGPARLWNSHLGQRLGPLMLRLSTAGQVPVTHVEHCAQALVLAAERQPEQGVEVINVVDSDLPDRAAYLRAVTGKTGLPVPWGWRLLAGTGAVLARTPLKVPGLLRPAVVHARLKPVTYSNARLRERLGWRPVHSFAQAIALSRAQEGDGTA